VSAPSASPLPRGVIKSTPEDFVVEEIPAYEASGEGPHVFVRFTKRGLTTDDAMRALARALGSDPREAGAAGMKDKHAVTTQTISLAPPRGETASAFAERAAKVEIDHITVHEAKPHTNKLKPGHLVGNRFTISVRDIARERVAEVIASLERVGHDGLPNAFGAQRFGREGDNAARARAWLGGSGPAPRDPRQRRFLWSALQSAIFNAVLDARVEDGTWASALEGDLLKRRTSGGLFLCTDVQADRARAAEGEVSPTGPILGVKMRSPEGAPAALEQRLVQQMLGESFDLAATKKLGEGSRRALRLWIEDLRVEPLNDGASEEELQGLRVYFVLPKGAYATTVLSSAVALEETRSTHDASTPDDAAADDAQAEDAPR
jgi:tRNA pseudouridine13 synthase